MDSRVLVLNQDYSPLMVCSVERAFILVYLNKSEMVRSANGQPDTSFGARGIRTYDFGGASDFFWGVALSPDRSRVALVGVKGVGTGTGNDDAVVHVMPVTPSS